MDDHDRAIELTKLAKKFHETIRPMMVQYLRDVCTLTGDPQIAYWSGIDLLSNELMQTISTSSLLYSATQNATYQDYHIRMLAYFEELAKALHAKHKIQTEGYAGNSAKFRADIQRCAPLAEVQEKADYNRTKGRI